MEPGILYYNLGWYFWLIKEFPSFCLIATSSFHAFFSHEGGGAGEEVIPWETASGFFKTTGMPINTVSRNA